MDVDLGLGGRIEVANETVGLVSDAALSGLLDLEPPKNSLLFDILCLSLIFVLSFSFFSFSFLSFLELIWSYLTRTIYNQINNIIYKCIVANKNNNNENRKEQNFLYRLVVHITIFSFGRKVRAKKQHHKKVFYY